jgi:glycosyltransferase involved in cell wall biosynthesis
MSNSPDTTPLKVIHVVARLNVGGVAPQVVLAVEGLRAIGFDAQIVCGLVGPDERDMGYVAEQKGITPVVIPELGRAISPFRDMITVWKLWRLFRRERPAVVQTHTAKAGFAGRLAARLAGVPVILHTYHGHVLRGYFGPRKTRLFTMLERLCGRLSTRVITLTARLKDELVGFGVAPADRFVIIPLGLELDALAETPRKGDAFRQTLGIDAETPLVGAVGRLVPIKHFDLMIDAIARLPGVHAALVGDGECRADLEAQVQRLGVSDRVHFAGWRHADALPAIYSDFDALVLSSNNEGMPVSIIEAMAAGTPVVATAVGGVPDLITDGERGILVPPDDAQALAGAIAQVLGNPAQAERLAAAARAHALANYRAERLAGDLAKLYTDLLG